MPYVFCLPLPFYCLNLCHRVCSILDEWENFLERIGRGDSGDNDIQEGSSDALELRFWASYRGQTLARTGLIVLRVIMFLYLVV